MTNISGGLINENIFKINQSISTISFSDEIDSIMNQLKPLFTARRFIFLHTQSLICYSRIISPLTQMKIDTDLIKAYLNIHSTGRLTPTIIDPILLRQELFKVHKQIPARLSLPEDPHSNIWHYYRFLTITPATNGNKLILMTKIPLANLDSGMNLYKIYNLPIYHCTISKSLKYQLGGTNLAMTKDNKYATILSDIEFIGCILAERHFCNLNTGLYHVDTSQWWVTAMFFKGNEKISKHSKITVNNIMGLQSNYLDQGHSAISSETPTQMEIKSEDHSHAKTI